MKVLVACEFSGIVREAFAKRGHNAWSCDLLPTEIPGQHIEGDVLKILYDGWDLMIAHPPCTRLTNSGVMWLEKRNLWKDMQAGALFFKELLEAPTPRKCIENPIMHKYAIKIIGRQYSQIIQPYQFGHTERKATCLWLTELPPLKTTKDVKAEMDKLPKNIAQRIHYTPPGKDRWKIRSKTFQGIADAMVEQWG